MGGACKARRLCAVAGLALVMVGGAMAPQIAAAGDVSAHGLQFALPTGLDGYRGYLSERWTDTSGGSPLEVSLWMHRGEGVEAGLDALAKAVKSQVAYYTQGQGWRLLDSTLGYTNGSLAFDVYFFLDSNEDALYAWSLVPLAGGGYMNVKVGCPLDDFIAQFAAIDRFFGSLQLDGSPEEIELYEAPQAVEEEPGAWQGVGTGQPFYLQEGVPCDGFYTAEGKGIGGQVPVTVVVKDGKIASVEVGDNSETAGIGSQAIEQLPEAIVAANGTEGVEAVSGATITSKAIFAAVEDCLEQASGDHAEAIAETEAEVFEVEGPDLFVAETVDGGEGAYVDGAYEAEGKGIGGKVPVTVEVKDGKIASVEVGENSETAGIGSKAIEQLPELIVEANGTEGVDAVSGATITSKAIFTAVDDCLEQASAGDAAAADDKAAAAAATYTDGAYEAEGKGIGGKVPVTVVVKDGKVSEVTVGDNSETAGIGSKAIEQLPGAIVAANGVEGVDGVSGATITSKAIFAAVEDCLAQASSF